jgi:hypothetical protein
MDATLEPLWRNGEKPFQGETIYPVADVFVRDAIAAIRSALDHIEQYYPTNTLFVLEDWHEHDGFIVTAKTATLDALREQIATPEIFISSHSDDTAVYLSIYPDSLDFLLRYSLFEAVDQSQGGREARWTFTGYGHDVAEMKKRWSPYSLVSETSAKYFREHYAG